MSKINSSLAMIALAAVCLSCTFLKDKFVKDPNAISTTVNLPEIQPFDRNAPLVSPGAEVVRRLAMLDPSLARFGPDIETVEREAMGKSIADAPGKPETMNEAEAALPPIKPMGFKTNYGESPASGALMIFQGGTTTSPADRVRAASLVAALVSGLKQIFSEGQTEATAAGGVKDTQTGTKDGTKTTMGVELKFQKDGSSTFGIELKTEAEKDGSKLVSDLKARVEGLDCPNAEGQVPITAKLRLGGESGGVGYTQEIEVFIRATVDEDSNIATRTFDIVQGTREIVKGDDIYVETGFTLAYAGSLPPKGTEVDGRIIRSSQSAKSNPAKLRSIALSGQDSAMAVAMAVLGMAEYKWQNGGCVKIDAPSPGSVAVNSKTQIPVKVVHKFEGTDVPSKLDAVLKGEKAIDPASIAKTAGMLTYTAPGEKNKTAKIGLTAVSRRGRATLELTAITGGRSYRVNGGSGGATFKGEICSLDKPFILTVDSITGSWPMKFTPQSETSGQIEGTYSASGCTQSGGGPYTVTLNEDGSGTIQLTFNATATCPAGSRTSSATSKVPLIPATDVSCP